jgi:hypothetical protein
MRMVRSLRLIAIVVALIGLAVVGAHGAAAQDAEASLTIHKAECFTGVGADIFEECHDDAVGEVSFEVNGDVFVADEAGVLVLEGDAGTLSITEDPDVFGDYLGAYVYCRDLTDDEVLFDGSATDSGGTVILEVEIDDEIVCDWYNITEATDDGGTSSGGTTTTLPATGSGPGSSNQPLILLLGALAGIAALSVGLRQRSAF